MSLLCTLIKIVDKILLQVGRKPFLDRIKVQILWSSVSHYRKVYIKQLLFSYLKQFYYVKKRVSDNRNLHFVLIILEEKIKLIFQFYTTVKYFTFSTTF